MSRRAKKYRLISINIKGDSAEDLENRVNTEIRLGSEPIGGICIDHQNGKVYQAMCEYETDEEVLEREEEQKELEEEQKEAERNKKRFYNEKV